MAQVATGPNARLMISPSHTDPSICILWVDPDLPGVDPSSVCFGTKEQLTWLGESAAAFHHFQFMQLPVAPA